MSSSAAALPAIELPHRPEAAPVPLDRALVTRACAGDARAFRRIFDLHAPAVRRFLGDLFRDVAAADEATQETFVRAHARLSTLRDPGKLRPWLLRIARFVWLETRRAQARTVHDDELAERRRDGAPSPHDLLVGREAASALDSALEGLGEDRRAALLLRIDHDLSYDEIAESMEWSPSKVKNEIHRARLELRRRLADYLRGER